MEAFCLFFHVVFLLVIKDAIGVLRLLSYSDLFFFLLFRHRFVYLFLVKCISETQFKSNIGPVCVSMCARACVPRLTEDHVHVIKRLQRLSRGDRARWPLRDPSAALSTLARMLWTQFNSNPVKSDARAGRASHDAAARCHWVAVGWRRKCLCSSRRNVKQRDFAGQICWRKTHTEVSRFGPSIHHL